MTTPYIDPRDAIDVASLGPATYTDLPGGAASGVVFAGRCALLGYSVTCGAAAGGISILDGSANAGLGVAGENVAASSSAVRWFGPQGIECQRGLFVATAGANTTATIYYQILPQV